MKGTRPLICQKVINEMLAVPEVHTVGASAHWKGRSSLCQSHCHDCFALLFLPCPLQRTITQFGILETLKAHRIPERTDKQLFSFLKWMNYWTPALEAMI